MNKIVKDALVLTLITLISGLALGIVYEVTKEPIAVASEKAKQESYKEVFALGFFRYVAFPEGRQSYRVRITGLARHNRRVKAIYIGGQSVPV